MTLLIHRCSRALLAASLAVTITACSDQSDPKSSAGAKVSAEVVRLADDHTVEVIQPKRRYKIGVLFPFTGIPFWTNEAYGIMDQAQKAGVDVVWLSADGYQNVDKQIRQLEDFVVQKVDAVILGATSYSGTVRAVENAVAKGVPVVNHVTSTNSDKVSSRVMTDYENIGRRQAEAMGTMLKGEGKVALLSGPAGAEWATSAVKGFKATLAEKYPKLVIAAERNSNPDRTEALRHTEDLLVAFPDLRGIFSVTDSLALGAADAVVRAGRIDNIEITTAGFSQDSLEAMKKGHIDVNVDESPLLTGRVALNTAISVLNGDKVPGTIFVPNPVITAAEIPNVKPERHWAPSDWKLR